MKGNRTFILWYLEGKRTLKMLPAMFAEAFVILGLLGVIAFGAARLLYRDSPVMQITIVLVEEQESPLMDMALTYVQGMESIAENCRFLPMSKEEGFAMLQEGKAAALVFLPDGVIEGILSGANVPVQVYFPENAGIESALLKELTDAGVRMLRVAQAQIYGIYDTAREYEALEELSVLEAGIDKYNLSFALERLALFGTQEVSATGALSFAEYGVSSGFIFFLLLLGMACYPMMQPYPEVVRRQLVREGVSCAGQCFGKWLCGLCALGIGSVCFGLAVKGGLSLTGHAKWFPQPPNAHIVVWVMTCVLILLCITTFVFWLFQMMGSQTAAILLLFLLAVVMMYASGGFLPASFLPEAVQKIGRFLPTTYLLEAAEGLYQGMLSLKTAGILMLFTAGFGAAAYGFGRGGKA
ncbi:MAG: ABC transporter permease [Ruminococcus sp.]|nr:ABC transporter permease [Ruminococcus sp.]